MFIYGAVGYLRRRSATGESLRDSVALSGVERGLV
jgi:hypothetical protein